MPIMGGGGGGGPAAGSYLPVANKTGVTVDSTTYDDTVSGSGKLTTLVFPASANGNVFLAAAQAGDAFPRWLLISDPISTAMLLGDGTFDPWLTAGTPGLFVNTSGGNQLRTNDVLSLGAAASNAAHAPRLNQLSPKFTIATTALPTVTLSSGTGAQVSTSRDVETVTPFTGDGTNNAATCKIELSPNNVTYSTLITESIAAALNLTGVLTITANVRVPAGWYVRLTATHGTLGTTTYY